MKTIYHMGEHRDWGCLNCKRNSTEIHFRKTHVFTHLCQILSKIFHRITVEKTFITGNWLLNFQKISKKSWPKIAKNVETHLKTPFSFLNIDSKFKTKIEFRLQFSRSNCPPVCAPFHTVEDWFNLKEAFRRGKINHRMERRRDWGCLNCKRNSTQLA